MEEKTTVLQASGGDNTVREEVERGGGAGGAGLGAPFYMVEKGRGGDA
jgi:hypothetical protein